MRSHIHYEFKGWIMPLHTVVKNTSPIETAFDRTEPTAKKLPSISAKPKLENIQ